MLRCDRRQFDYSSAELRALPVPALSCCLWGARQLCVPPAKVGISCFGGWQEMEVLLV